MGLLALLGGSVAPGQSAPGAVRWQDIPDHLQALGWEGKGGITPCDCPEGIEQGDPDRAVAQWIENTFYRWDEYVLVGEDGRECVCVVMERPQASVLLREEAAVLLSASMLWTRGVEPDSQWAETLDADDPSLDRVTITPRVDGDEVTRGGERETREYPALDDRQRVTATTTYPYNTVAYMGMNIPAGNGHPSLSARGSAFLVGPYSALTCGHNVYDLTRGRWASSAVLAMGQRQYTHGGAVDRPYGSIQASQLFTLGNYISSSASSNEQFRYDIGAVGFASPVGSITTYMPVQFDYSASPNHILNTVGYPLVVQGRLSDAQWISSGRVLSSNSWNILHSLYATGGNSGGPTFAYYGDDTFRVVGVLVAQGPTETWSARFASWNQATVMNWISYTPEGVTPPDPENEMFFVYPSGLATLFPEYFTTRVGADWVDGIVGANDRGPGYLSLDLSGWSQHSGTVVGIGEVTWWSGTSVLGRAELPISGRITYHSEITVGPGANQIEESARVRYRIVARDRFARAQVGADMTYRLDGDSVAPAVPVTARISLGKEARASAMAWHVPAVFGASVLEVDPRTLWQGNNALSFSGTAPIEDLMWNSTSRADVTLKFRPNTRTSSPGGFASLTARTPTGRVTGNVVVPRAPSASFRWVDQPMYVRRYTYRGGTHRLAVEYR